MSWLRIARHAFRVGAYEFRGIYGWQEWVFASITGSVAQVAFFAMLGSLLDSDERLQFLLIGTALTTGCFRANVAIAASTWDRWDGTYPLLVIAPSSLVPAIVGRTAAWMIDGAATALLALLIARLVFDLPIPFPEVLLLPPLVLVSCASSFFLATAIGSIVTRAPRTRNIVHRFETMAITLFCGVAVPISFWPAWLELVANFLPVTHGLQAIRLLLDGGPAGEIAISAFYEVLVGLGWLAIGALIIDRMADGGRRDGSIEFI